MDITTPQGMAEAVVWTRINVVNKLRDGGTWIVPRSGTLLTLFHSTKTVRISSMLPDDAMARVFKHMGWKVENLDVTPTPDLT